VGGAVRRPLILGVSARFARGQAEVRNPLRFCICFAPKRIFAIMNLRSTIRLLILMAVFGFSLSNRVERTKGGHLSFNNFQNP